MKRRLALAAALAGAFLAFVITRPPAPANPPARPDRVARAAPAPVTTTFDADLQQETPWQTYADRVTTDCGFEVTSACTPSGCAAVCVVPDLDRLGGWVNLGWNQPGLVAGIALAELGVVERHTLPCVAAIRSMYEFSHLRQTIGNGPDGTWLVCLWAPSETVTDRTPCEEVAARRGLRWHVSDPQRRL
jgi:hypothetical protein